jgi:hypothetical protein
LSGSKQTPDLAHEFEHAAQAYGRTLGGFPVSALEREDAARNFQASAVRFWDRGADAFEFAARALGGQLVATASRLLLMTADPLAQEKLVEAFLGPKPLLVPSSHYALLGLAAPLPSRAWSLLDRPHILQRPAILRALLREPTARAKTLLESTLAKGSAGETCAAVRAAALWGEEDLLRSWVHSPGGPRLYRFEAAVQLALSQGSSEAVAWLEEIAGRTGDWAVEACRRLCQLALPRAVDLIARQIRSAGDDDVSLLLEPVRLLGAMAIGPVVLERLESEIHRPQQKPGASLIDRLITGLGDLTGVPLPDRLSDSVGVDEALASGRRAVSFYRERLQRFDLRLRYWGAPANRLQHEARPITLDVLIDALGDAGNPALAEAATNQMRAMTGEQHGFDCDYDLIANLPAIEAWRARARTPLPVEQGGWMYQGRPIASPRAP